MSASVPVLRKNAADKLSIHCKLNNNDDACDNYDIVGAIQQQKSIPATKSPPPNKFKKLLRKLGPVLTSAFVVAALMYPLDLVRALQMADASSGTKLSTTQLLRNFCNAHGIQGLFTQGLAPELARSTWMRFMKFSLYPLFHTIITGGIEESKGSILSKSMAAILSSIPEAITIMPLEIAKIALQLDSTNRFKNNMFSALGVLFKDRGLQVFQIGYLGVQLRQGLWSLGYFTSIGFIQKNIEMAITKIAGPDYKLKEHPGANTVAIVVAGFMAGVFGGLLNTPCDIIRTSMQKKVLTQAIGTAIGGNSFLSVGQEVLKARGLLGLYVGFKFKSLHLGGGGALMAFFLPLFNDIFEKICK